MRVLVGNRRPKVGYKLPDDKVVYEFLPPGDYVTEVRAADFTNVVGALTLHFAEDEKPTWVSCESEAMEARLCEYYGIETNLVPEQWSTHAN